MNMNQQKKQKKPKEVLCNARCESCIYHTQLSLRPETVACYYMVYEYKRRPCPPGKECTVYMRGVPLEQVKAKMGTAIAPKKMTKRCERCGKEIVGIWSTRYCLECSAQRDKESKERYYAKEKAERKARNLSVPRECLICGKTYHTAEPHIRYCEDCRKLSKYRRKVALMKKERANG